MNAIEKRNKALDRRFNAAWSALDKCRNNPWKGMTTMEILKKIREC
ncbi:MAG: hypothetical protein KJ955_01265 [Nanoarchaeota archaeon]|nr:hypothetical protein [Nanoarchaeota archaeon]